MFQPCQCHDVGFGTVDEILLSTVHRPHCDGDAGATPSDQVQSAVQINKVLIFIKNQNSND